MARAKPPSDAAGPAREALMRLLRRAELAVASGRSVEGAPWNEHDLPTTALDPCRHLLEQAETSGAVLLERGRGYRDGIVQRIRLGNVDALARFVGEDRWAGRAVAMEEAIAPALDGAAEWVQGLAERCRARWVRDEQPFGLRPGNLAAALETFMLLRALGDGRPTDVDPRTFSLQAAGRTKALEDRKPHVVSGLRAAFSFPEGMSAEDVLSTFGLTRFQQPLLVRAPLSLPGYAAGPITQRPYVGIPPEMIASLGAGPKAPYLLIIENLTTFNRYVREVADDGLVLYAGGFPTKRCREAARRLAASTDRVFHWGDIDPGGVRIFALLEQEVTGLRPHLMSEALAREHGVASAGDPTLAALAASGSAGAGLAAFLAAPLTWRLEQESLEPCPPT